MLLFRSEEHVQRWCSQWNQSAGEIFGLAPQWRLAQAWYGDRLEPDWRRKTTEEAEALFLAAGLTSDFWRLR